MRDMVLVLNFDDSHSRAVARKLRAMRIYCKIVPGDSPLHAVEEQQPLGVILAGGACADTPAPDIRLLDGRLPVLALGGSAARMCRLLGGGAQGEGSRNRVLSLQYAPDCPLLLEIDGGERMISCSLKLSLPESLRPIATAGEEIIGFAHTSLPLYGMQFLVEQNDPDGAQLLSNFAQTVCGCTTWWDDDAFVQRAVEEIGRVAGDGTALCAISGGVDSGVCAMLAHRALGERLQCLFVDTGLLRENEVQDVLRFYRDEMGLNLRLADAREQFLSALSGVKRAADKERIISALLQNVLTQQLHEISHADVLIRGTNFNDVMNGADRLAPDLPLRGAAVVEPVRELFKDEIRRIAEFLGLPASICGRQPFPGSGLALRILTDVTPERLAILRRADAIFREEIAAAGQGKRLWQHFAVLSKMPGEQGEYVVCLRAVHAVEGAQAYAARLPYDLLERVTQRLLTEAPVARVVYDLTPSNHYTGIEWQ